jgi:hypothetical protein
MNFPPADLGQLAKHGIPPAEAERQLTQLRGGQTWLRLARPCTLGDGICTLPADRHPALLERFAAAAAAGRVTRFVPASGAASRVFEALQSGDPAALQRFLAELDNFPFAAELAVALSRIGQKLDGVRRSGNLSMLLAALLETHGLGYARLPKGLLPFHRTAGEVRTAFAEHLAETAQLVGAGNPARVHCTVSPEHRALFAQHLAAWQEALEQRYSAPLEVTFSEQQPATDTLALGADGEPLRDADGRLVLRPGGHGALLANLAALAGDLVLIRNIDNVVPDRCKGDNLLWDRLLGGLLLELTESQRTLLERLRRYPADAVGQRRAQEFLGEELGIPLADADRGALQLVDLLDRPVRVCGMVANQGEPGGGPFWVYDKGGGISRQIVEAAQVDGGDPHQAAILAAATHFNPVDMVCSLRDGRGRAYPLEHFVDQTAAIVTSKRQNGQPIGILERPGLWNGGMAGWLTVFVELPACTFNPVKTVFDLLRPAHQP